MYGGEEMDRQIDAAEKRGEEKGRKELAIAVLIILGMLLLAMDLYRGIVFRVASPVVWVAAYLLMWPRRRQGT